jgi:16S rRNA G966 N2-methylase RsmD
MLKQNPDQAFDYVYIAPPQYKNLWLDALNMVNDHPGWVKEDGWIIVQIHPVEYQPVDISNFIEFEQRKYGSTLLVFYERKTDETE